MTTMCCRFEDCAALPRMSRTRGAKRAVGMRSLRTLTWLAWALVLAVTLQGAHWLLQQPASEFAAATYVFADAGAVPAHTAERRATAPLDKETPHE